MGLLFNLQVNSMLPTKFQVNWPFGSGEEAKNRFSRWPPWWPCWISDQNDFSNFLSTSHPDASNQVSGQLAFLVQEKKGKIDFQDGCHGGQLRFPIGMILAIFDLQVTPLLPSKFLINWHSIMLTPITWILLMFLAVCGKERS